MLTEMSHIRHESVEKKYFKIDNTMIGTIDDRNKNAIILII